mmetsp:Transcript_13081/g.28240  ORF Transcript_13081/g.28240 Transcript_13081/m.28240 type:complete len:246 (-) Transcript_13081:45-782(-)
MGVTFGVISIPISTKFSVFLVVSQFIIKIVVSCLFVFWFGQSLFAVCKHEVEVSLGELLAGAGLLEHVADVEADHVDSDLVGLEDVDGGDEVPVPRHEHHPRDLARAAHLDHLGCDEGVDPQLHVERERLLLVHALAVPRVAEFLLELELVADLGVLHLLERVRNLLVAQFIGLHVVEEFLDFLRVEQLLLLLLLQLIPYVLLGVRKYFVFAPVDLKLPLQELLQPHEDLPPDFEVYLLLVTLVL